MHLNQAKQGNWFKKHKIITTLLIIVGCFTLVAIVSGSANKSNTSQPSASEKPTQGAESASAKYEATVQEYNVTDPATLKVNIKVHNVGTVSGKPSCYIEAGKPTDAYHGFDRVVREEELGPDGWWGFAQNITISNQGATHIKEVKVECK